ncbi:Ig-like domain-containing protein [Candidatus Williamhamiltonella defendens]|uniref:Ig-like domain-containing protein n=1 Tax=Candidatus Williamhamiltonella defendens TaxID=138072 RepID=UPI003CCC6D52
MREPGYEYTSELGEKGKSKNYSLTVTTYVGEKNKESDTIDVLIDNQLTIPKIMLDPDTHHMVSGNRVSSKTPTFRLTDIDPDVREIKLTFSNESPSITFNPTKELSEELIKQGVSKKEGYYTYTPQKEWTNDTYTITLTVKDQATNEQSYAYDVIIDTSTVETPKIILQEDNSFNQKKNITKTKNPTFKLETIDKNAQNEIQISVFSVDPRSSSTELGSKKITIQDATQKGFDLSKLSNSGKGAVNITQDGKYQIEAVVTSTAGSKSAPGILDFTIDSADAPTPTIELVDNTGTNDKPVTNKTQPKLILKNIDSSRLDWDNPQLIKVTFLKKLGSNEDKKTQNFVQSQINIKESDDSTESEYELTWNKEDLTPGEYTVTAKVTYQAGQVGNGSLNNNHTMTIYTTPPTSTIQFLEELGKVDGQFKVSKSQMKFQIVPNEKDVPPGRGTTSVQVILKDLEGNQQKTQTAILNEEIWTADLSEPDQISKGGKYQVVAKVTDPHGNEGLSQPLSFELLDGLNPPVIKINAEDHTPYDQNEDPNIKITSKRTPQFTFDEIDDVVNKVTVSVSKSKEKNADPKTIKYTKIPEGKWKNDEDDQGYNSNQIPILFQEDGEYNMTLKAETTGGLEATSNILTLGVYVNVIRPSIAVEGKDEREVLSGTATPTFEIKNVDPHAREINITATLGKSEETAKKFQAVLNQDGSIKTKSDNGFFEQIESGYQFIPSKNLDEGKYNIVVSVINEARQPSSNSLPLGLIIDTSKPQQPSIVLSEASNTTHPDSLHEKWTSSRKPTFTIDLKDNNTDNPIEKVEVMVKGVGNKTYIAQKNNSTNQFVTDSPSQKGAFSLESNKKLTFTPDDEWAKGEYSLSVKTYNSLNKPGDVSETEVVNVNYDQPDQPKIELAYADQTGKTIDKSNTKITNNPNPSFAISNINLKQDNIDERAVTITITKDGESKITGAKVTHDTGQFSYKTSNFKDTYGDGEYNATVRVINKAGIPSDSQEFTFEIDTTEPDKPEINWNSEAFKTAKNSDELKAVAKKGQIVFLVTTSEEIDDPRYITAKINNTGSLSAKEKVKDSKNVWKLTSNDSLSSGKHNLYVEVTDKAGNKTSAQGEFMVLDALPAPKIDMAHNANAAGKDRKPYMINKVNMDQDDKRKLNIILDDNTLFSYVEMKAELISESSGSSSVLSIKKNNPDNNWTVEIPADQPDGKYTLKVTATDVLTMTKETEVDFEVDTTLTNIPVIELKNSGTKSSDSTDAQETTQTKPVFMIRDIPEDIYKINIQISGDNNDYEIKNLEGFKGDSKEWGGIKKDLEDDKEYFITVTFTDKAGNTSNNDNNLYNIKKIAPFVFKDPELILDPQTDSGTQGDFKTNHDKPVLLFKNTSDAKVTEGKLTLENKTANKSYTYPFKDFTPTGGPDSKEYKIDLIKNDSLTDKTAAFPAGEYRITVELTYDNNETYQKKTTLNDPLIINRHKPSAVSDVKYSFNETEGVKTIRIEGEKPKNTDVFIQFKGQSEINITKKGNTSVFDVEAFDTTQSWGQQKSFTLFVKDDIGNQSENTQVDIPLPPAITRYRALDENQLEVFVKKENLKQGDKIILKNQSNEKYEHTVTAVNLSNNSFQFTTNNAFTGKFTAYVIRAERHESEKIERTIPKTPTEVDYTFVGNGKFFSVKGKVKEGETLNTKLSGIDNTQKSHKAYKEEVVRTKVIEHNVNEMQFEVFSSNEEGGESQSIIKTINPVVLYWDYTSGHYFIRFSGWNPEDDQKLGAPYPQEPFKYSHELRVDAALIKYKTLPYKSSQNYRVIEFDDSFLYELCRYVNYDLFEDIRKRGAKDFFWKFNGFEPGALYNSMKFISLEEVLKFIKSDELWDPDGDIDKKNHLMRVLTTQWNIRPVNVSTEISSGKTIIKGQINKRIEGEIFLLDGNSNPIIQTYSTTYSDEAGKINFETKLDGVIQDRSNMYLYFKTKDTSNSIISFWVNIQPGAETNHDNREKTMFENLYKKAERILETGEHHDTVFSDIHFDEEMDESPKTEEHQSNPEKTNQPTESSPEESTTEEPSERSKRSTSLTEQEENPVDTQTQAQQVNPTQPQKQDIPSELLEEPKTAAPKNPGELLNPITSEENTTADTTPSFTLNAPKDAPDAVKALVTLDNRPEYELELIDNQGVFTVEMPLAEGPHELKVKFIEPDGDWIRLDKTFTIDASSERILSSLETPDKYQIDLSTGSKTIPSKENADILMMTPVLHLPEHEEESTYYS